MNKPVYLSLLILDKSKKIMYEFPCNYAKPRYKIKQNYATWIQRAL